MAAHIAETTQPGNPKAFITAMRSIHEAKRKQDPSGPRPQDIITARTVYDKESKRYEDALKDYYKAVTPKAFVTPKINPEQLIEMQSNLRTLWDSANTARENLREMNPNLSLGELPAPPKSAAVTGRAATTKEYREALAASGADVERFKAILRAKGIDPSLPKTP